MNINGSTLNMFTESRSLNIKISTPEMISQASLQGSSNVKATITATNEDEVSISQEGRAALSTDNALSDKVTDTGKALSSSLGSALYGHYSMAAKKAKEAEKEQDLSPIDKQIQEVKKQIEALQQRLQELEGNNSESAENETKMILSQILELTSVLVSLIDKKAENATSS